MKLNNTKQLVRILLSLLIIVLHFLIVTSLVKFFKKPGNFHRKISAWVSLSLTFFLNESLKQKVTTADVRKKKEKRLLVARCKRYRPVVVSISMY